MWLFKAEPDSRIVKGRDVKYSIDDLEQDKTSMWEGVRNYEARNHMRRMQVGDLGLFYRSNCKHPGVVGVCRVSKAAYNDPTALDSKHPYFDPKAIDKTGNNKWDVVDVEYVRHLPPVLLSDIKDNAALQEMALLKRSRLSVSSVRETEFDEILRMAGVTDKELAELKEPKAQEEDINNETKDAKDEVDEDEST